MNNCHNVITIRDKIHEMYIIKYTRNGVGDSYVIIIPVEKYVLLWFRVSSIL